MRTVCNPVICTGCGLCANLCPVQAVTIEDKLGFFSPIIDPEKCIECNRCTANCPQINPQIYHTPICVYEGWDDAERETSSSGGIASSLSRVFFNDGSWVVGCVFNGSEFVLKLSNSVDDLCRMKGSKYLKSSSGLIYNEVFDKLKQGEKVLFIGLPCQIAAMNSYVKRFSCKELLYTVDLICHGAPSQQILLKFLDEKRVFKSAQTTVSFRKGNSFAVSVDGKRINKTGAMDRYTIAYLNRCNYTNSCYSCKYAQRERVSDITIGDSWGSSIRKEEVGKGVSLVICNTEKGKRLISSIRSHGFELNSADYGAAILHNGQLKSPSDRPKEWDSFFDRLNSGMRICDIVFSLYKKQCIQEEIIDATKLVIKRILNPN